MRRRPLAPQMAPTSSPRWSPSVSTSRRLRSRSWRSRALVNWSMSTCSTRPCCSCSTPSQPVRLGTCFVRGLKVLLAHAVETVAALVSVGGLVKSAGQPPVGGCENVILLCGVTVYRHPTTTLGGWSREITLPGRAILHTDQGVLWRKQLVGAILDIHLSSLLSYNSTWRSYPPPRTV